MAPLKDRREIAETHKTAPYVPRQLQLHPELRKPRLSELGNDADGDILQRQGIRFARRHQIQSKSLRKRMSLPDEVIERQRNFSGIARHTGRLQRNKIAIDRPNARRALHLICSWRTLWGSQKFQPLGKVMLRRTIPANSAIPNPSDMHSDREVSLTKTMPGSVARMMRYASLQNAVVFGSKKRGVGDWSDVIAENDVTSSADPRQLTRGRTANLVSRLISNSMARPMSVRRNPVGCRSGTSRR